MNALLTPLGNTVPSEQAPPVYHSVAVNPPVIRNVLTKGDEENVTSTVVDAPDGEEFTAHRPVHEIIIVRKGVGRVPAPWPSDLGAISSLIDQVRYLLSSSR